MVINSKRNNLDNTEEINPKKRKIINEDNMKKNQNIGKRMIKLYCPTISKIAEIMVLEDQRLDIGTIARIFGFEPATLKLNGHFISRGVDLISSSVTWSSLVSFFSSKGFSTGIHSSTPLIVHGKLYKSGTKRTHETTEAWVDVCRYSHHDEINSPSTKKLKDSHNVSAVLGRDSQTARRCDTGLKRRHWVEDTSPFKKVRVNGSYLDVTPLGHGVNGRCCISELRCGYQMTENMKRLREDEVIMGASCKKTR